MQLNLLTPMLLSRAVAPGMKERRSGCIINIGSESGTTTTSMVPVYAASKHGRLLVKAMQSTVPSLCQCVAESIPLLFRTQGLELQHPQRTASVRRTRGVSQPRLGEHSHDLWYTRYIVLT